jgi:hypothetical protein
MDNHRSASFEIPTKDDELDLPSLYCMPKVHKYSLKQRYIAGSSKCYRRGICVKLSYFVLLINVVSLLMCFPHNIQKIITCTKADLY